MGKFRDSKTRSLKGEVVLINGILNLKISYKGEKHCNCHPETCIHFNSKISYNNYEYYNIINYNDVIIGEIRGYHNLIDLGNNTMGVYIL